ncbi:MAG TPA: hypothetical protein VKE70_26785 [Candidatus Solibacter sp.]|nr:hypothetical protein [Candidatus Solibacter sp.]
MEQADWEARYMAEVGARIYLSRERSDHTLQPTELFNEPYIRLAAWSMAPNPARSTDPDPPKSIETLRRLAR